MPTLYASEPASSPAKVRGHYHFFDSKKSVVKELSVAIFNQKSRSPLLSQFFNCRQVYFSKGYQMGFRMRIIGAAMLSQLLLVAISSGSDDWSRFRGPNGSGVTRATGLPFEFGPDKNVIWKTALPQGHSSPILSDNLIFLTALENDKLFTYCLDRETGTINWRRESPRDRIENLDNRNNPASPSPVTDGENVFVFFADYGLIGYDISGNTLWQLPLGPFNNLYGMGASPILSGENVVLVCDQSTGSFIISVDKKSGKVAWKTARPEAKSGHSTPILYNPGSGKDQLIVPGSFFLTAYASESGKKVWWVNGLSFEMKSTPVMSDDAVFINGYGSPLNQPENMVKIASFEEIRPKHDMNGDGKLSVTEMPDNRSKQWFSFMDLDKDSTLNSAEWDYYKAALSTKNGMLSIRLGGKGDMSETNIRWQYHRSVPQLPSPLLYKNILYMINDGGIVTSFNPETGEVMKQGRLEGAVDSYYSSPVAADNKIFMIGRSGKAAVIKPDGSLEVMIVNNLDDRCFATPAISGNRIYIRTQSTLYCFGQ